MRTSDWAVLRNLTLGTISCILLLCLALGDLACAQTLTTLHTFAGPDGSLPVGSLIQASDGNFYSTTSAGGATGGGVIFKMTPSGTLTTLYTFCSQSHCTDGAAPVAGLIQATNGNFYGNASVGGLPSYSGTVFKITPSGTLTTLHNFCSLSNCADGSNPLS